jgi:Adenylate and Guanylate cyclase catalytic domain
VGINTGDAVVRTIKTDDAHTEYTPIGHSTGLASRMQTLAPTGSIAVIETTEKLGAGYFTFKALGPTRVKGATEPVNVFEATGLGPLRTRLQLAAGRGLTKFVGREREMRRSGSRRNGGAGTQPDRRGGSRGRYRQVAPVFRIQGQEPIRLDCAGSVLGITRKGLRLLSGHRSASPLFQNHGRRRPARDAQRSPATSSPSTGRLKTRFRTSLRCSAFQKRKVRSKEWTRRFAARRTLDAVKRLLLRESLNQPLMVIFEDLHWIDEETQAFLNLMAD